MTIDKLIDKLGNTYITNEGTVLDHLNYEVPIGMGVITLLVLIILGIYERKKNTANESSMISSGDLLVFSLIPLMVVVISSLVTIISLGLITYGGKSSIINSYVKGLDTTKVELREFEKDSVEVRDVINKKNDKLYADVWVAEKDTKMGAFISHMKIVRDLKYDEASYVTYKNISKSIKLGGNSGSVMYKKGWAKVELHVPQGLKTHEIANHVKASVNGDVVE